MRIIQLFIFWVILAGGCAGCAYHDSIELPTSQPQETMNIHIISDGLSSAYLIENTSGLILVDTGNKGNE